MFSSNTKVELQIFFRLFTIVTNMRKKSTVHGNQVKKRNHAMTANLFNVILPEKDQWHILTFGPKTERVSRCWSLLWKKKVHKSIGISQTPSCNISLYWCGKWWILLLRENAEFWFKDVQNAWIHFWNRFTFKSHSSFLVFENALSESDPKKNAGWDIYTTPKFWHKIQDLQKSVEYLLNRPRLALTKIFLQLWDVLRLVYNTQSWP